MTKRKKAIGFLCFFLFSFSKEPASDFRVFSVFLEIAKRRGEFARTTSSCYQFRPALTGPAWARPTTFQLIKLEETGLLHENRNVIAEKIPELKSLSPEEKLILVGELWDELAARPDAFPPREDHIELLKERLEHYRKHPTDVVAWEHVKARILRAR